MSTDGDRLADLGVDGFLEALASDAATPGGGAAAAIAGAAGAAMIAMVGRLTVGKRGFEELAERMGSMVERADGLRGWFVEAADRDARAFDSVMAAFRMPKETDEQKAARSAAIQSGTESAAQVPLEIARTAVDAMELAEDAAAMGNPQAASDGMSAAACLYAAVRCALANVRINAASLEHEERRAALTGEADAIHERADVLLAQAETAFKLRLAR